MAGDTRNDDPELRAIDELAAVAGRRGPTTDARTRRRSTVLIGFAVAALLVLGGLGAWIALAP